MRTYLEYSVQLWGTLHKKYMDQINLPIPGGLPGQVRWGFEQSGLVASNPNHSVILRSHWEAFLGLSLDRGIMLRHFLKKDTDQILIFMPFVGQWKGARLTTVRENLLMHHRRILHKRASCTHHLIYTVLEIASLDPSVHGSFLPAAFPTRITLECFFYSLDTYLHGTGPILAPHFTWTDGNDF